jgi:hypothetical protein
MLSSGPAASNPIRFQLVRSISWSNPQHLHDNAPATIGEPITNTFGRHDPAAGGPWVVQAASVYCPLPGFHDRAARSGPVIPVNKDRPSTDADDLVLACYQKGERLYDPATGASIPHNAFWPAKPVRYRPAWPANPPKIIIASLEGTREIDPETHRDWDLYFQNDPAQPGFNPNDEHALRRPFGAGEALFALRDDLGSAETSEPYVLMSYRDPAAGLQGRMKVFRVVAEEAPCFFEYPATAGSLLQPPFPISTLQNAEPSHGVSGPYWRDRKKSFWAKAAGNDGGTATIVMRFFYPMQPVGAPVPFLDHRAGTPGTPHNVAFTVSWPEAPELRAGETLVTPKFGLPDISQQTSVEILYQQAATQSGSSVKLIDPTREISVDLDQLPADVETYSRSGHSYFSALPPTLRNRLRHDPINRKLIFRGEFIEPAAGESYLLLNVITPRERAILLALSNDPAFDAAIQTLADQASSVIEVPPDAASFDSLATRPARVT